MTKRDATAKILILSRTQPVAASNSADILKAIYPRILEANTSILSKHKL
jgi:hypothetical protein